MVLFFVVVFSECSRIFRNCRKFSNFYDKLVIIVPRNGQYLDLDSIDYVHIMNRYQMEKQEDMYYSSMDTGVKSRYPVNIYKVVEGTTVCWCMVLNSLIEANLLCSKDLNIINSHKLSFYSWLTMWLMLQYNNHTVINCFRLLPPPNGEGYNFNSVRLYVFVYVCLLPILRRSGGLCFRGVPCFSIKHTLHWYVGISVHNDTRPWTMYRYNHCIYNWQHRYE